MRTTDRVRALFEEGATIEVIENTYRPELNGTLRRITKLGKSYAECDVLTGPRAGTGGFRMTLPIRASDVVAVSNTGATWKLGPPASARGTETVTVRRPDGSP